MTVLCITLSLGLAIVCGLVVAIASFVVILVKAPDAPGRQVDR